MRKEFEPYEQKTKFSCAPASLKIGYRSLGQNYSEKLLRTELNTTNGDDKNDRGTYWRDVMANPSKHGFKRIYRSNLSYKNLRLWTQERSGFVIVSLMNYREDPPDGHFAVLKSALDEHVILVDPGIARITRMGKEKWLQAWSHQDPSRPAMLVWKEE